jgi:hypothetical protein
VQTRNQVEFQGDEVYGWGCAHHSEHDLRQREGQCAQSSLLGRCSANNTGPQLLTVQKLPASDLASGLSAFFQKGSTQVQRQLPDVEKGLLVGQDRIAGVQLGHALSDKAKFISNEQVSTIDLITIQKN